MVSIDKLCGFLTCIVFVAQHNLYLINTMNITKNKLFNVILFVGNIQHFHTWNMSTRDKRQLYTNTLQSGKTISSPLLCTAFQMAHFRQFMLISIIYRT